MALPRTLRRSMLQCMSRKAANQTASLSYRALCSALTPNLSQQASLQSGLGLPQHTNTNWTSSIWSRYQNLCTLSGSMLDSASHCRSFHSSALFAAKVVVPSMGDSITEGTIANVLKAAGDAVKEDEPIAMLETDKVTMDIKSPVAGSISSLAVSCCLTVVHLLCTCSERHGLAA